MQLSCKTTAWGLAVLCISLNAKSQVGIGTTTPDPASILHVQSTTRGVLLPRLTSGQMTTLSGTLTTSEKGMLVADSATGALQGWNGVVWTDPANLSATTPLSVSRTNQVSLNPGTATGDLITWDGNNWISTQAAVQHFTFNTDNRQPFLAVNYCIALQGIFPARNDAFVSQIQIFPFNFPPRGWAQCDGQLMPISQNTALFSLLGTQYGGDGRVTFALPDLRSRVALSFGQGPGLSQYEEGATGGEESHTISY
jgi:microcystin-dependent protein